MDERERAKLADLEAAGITLTQRHLQRLRQAYRDEGLIGLADKRALRSRTPGADSDPRVIEAIGALPEDIREQASWGRPLSDPQWGSPLPSHGTPRKIPFIDITDDYERPAIRARAA